MERIAADVSRIRKDVDSILHGNGRKGVWALSDAVFGPPSRPDEGLVRRVGNIESHARENKILQRGIAIGIALVALDTVFGLNLAALVQRLIGGIS